MMRTSHYARVSLITLSAAAASITGCRNGEAHAAAPPPLRVCADPNNLPFSDSLQNGFENRIADVIAKDLGTRVAYTWWAQRRGFVRNTLRAGLCDVVIGIPAS